MKPKLSLPQIFAIVLLITLSPAPCALSQVPQGFNYQAVAHSSSGAPIMNTTLQVKAGILSDTITPVVVWEELHSAIKTNAYGVFNLVVGKGARQAGSSQNFSDVDWTNSPLYLKIQIYYQGAWKVMGHSKLWSVPYSMSSGDISAPLKKLSVAGETDNLAEALFEVKNKDGQTVFAVYNEGVRIYVSDGDTKGPKGGFAIGGFGTTKAPSQPYFIVRPDSIRMYLYDTVKAAKGGFAIGGYGTTKARNQDYLFVSSDSIRAYIDNSSVKGPKGGFAIGGFGTIKNKSGQYFNVSTDTSNIINPSQNRILWYPLKNAFLAGRVLIESPDSVGINSFATGYESKAKGQFSQAMGYKATARGDFSTAIGKNAIAGNINSFAFGENASARNGESYAFGRGAIAEGFRSFAFGSAGIDSVGQITGVAYAKGIYSFALGMGSQALGDGSFAMGIADTAKGSRSFAFGQGTSATGWGATSMGMFTRADGTFSTSMGYKTRASSWVDVAIGNGTVSSGGASFAGGSGCSATGDNSLSYGLFNLASGSKSVALGYRTAATSWHAFAMGDSAQANGDNSVAFGFKTIARGGNTLTIGNHTQANNPNSVAMGDATQANGDNSLALGFKTIANGNNTLTTGSRTKATNVSSVAMGFLSVASGACSAALGCDTRANSFNVLVTGRYNDTTNMTDPIWISPTDPVFVIGNGDSHTNRRNALTVLQNSNVGINMVNPQQMLDIAGGNGRVESGYNWLTNSDIRFKKNIVTIENPLEKVMAMHGVRFDLINDNSPADAHSKNIGFIAQELEAVVPEVVITGSDGYKSVAYDKLTAVLTEAIKEQQKQIESQQKEINELKEIIRGMDLRVASTAGAGSQ